MHQLRAVFARRVFVEEIELSNVLAEEVAKHDPGFLVAMAIFPDGVQATRRGVDNVAAILRWCEQLYRGAITVISLVHGKWRRLYERRGKTAILMLAAKLFGAMRCIAAKLQSCKER